MMRICVIGCGEMSSRGHGPSLKRYASLHPDAALLACCDLKLRKAEAYARSFGFARAYSDMDQMLDEEKPDAVMLIVPVPLTAALSIRIMERGIPLLTEKPPGVSLEETKAMLAAAKKTGTANAVAFNRRHMPILRAAMEEYRGETPEFIRYDFFRSERQDEDFSTTAIHGIDAVRHLAGADYAEIRLSYQHSAGRAAHVVNIYMDCLMRNGCKAYLSFCPVAGAALERATVLLPQGRLIFANLPFWGGYDHEGELCLVERGRVLSRKSAYELSDADEYILNGFYHENEAFLDALRRGERPGDAIATALQVMEITQCVRRREDRYPVA